MELKEILKKAEKIEEFEERIIVFLAEKEFKYLYELKEKEIKELIRLGNSEEYAKKTAMRDYFKIINPSLNPVKVLSFGYRKVYSLVKNKDIILAKYLERDFYMWANHKRKELKKFIEDFVGDEREVKKKRDEVEEEIKEKEKLLNEILKNPDKYNLIRTDLEFRNPQKIYSPIVNIREFSNGEFKPAISVYLRENVPNIVWEIKEKIPRKPRPSIVTKELEEYENVFGRIYLKAKDE